MSRNTGPLARAKKGATFGDGNARQPSGKNTRRKQLAVMEQDEDVFKIDDSLLPHAAKSDIESIHKRQFGGDKKKRATTRKRRQATSSGIAPLDLAQERQGGLRQSGFLSSSSSSTSFTGRIPRKSDKKRPFDESSRSDPVGEIPRESPLKRFQNKANSALDWASRTTNNLREKFNGRSPGANGLRPRSNNSDSEVVDLCDDDDDDDDRSEQYQEGDTTITEHSIDGTSPRRNSSASGRTLSSASSGRSSRASRGSSVSHGSSSTSASRTPGDRSAMSSSKGESSDGGVEITRDSAKKRSNILDRFKARNPGTTSSQTWTLGTSDLYPAPDAEEEQEASPNVCNMLEDIQHEPFAGKPAARERKAQSKKRPPPGECIDTRKTSPKSSASSSPSSPFAWGNAPTLNIRKVNAKKQRKKNTIVPGRAIGRAPQDPTATDPIIEDSDSEVEEHRPRSRLRRKGAAGPAGVRRDPPARTGGVQRNPYATGARRTFLSRKAKTKSSKDTVVDLNSDDEYEYDDSTILADLGADTTTTEVNKRIQLGAVRIAIGKKVQSKNCKFLYKRNSKVGKMMLSYNDANGDRMKHEINLDDASVKEMKYSLANDDADDTVAIDFDETEEMTFLVMQVEPSDDNGLKTFPNAYKPSETQTDPSKKYIAIEFRSDSDFKRLLRQMKEDPMLGAFVDESSKLKPSQVEEYGSSLLKEAKKERAVRESSMGSPRIRRTRKKKHGSKVANEVVLVFPFGADEKEIDKAASGLYEAGHMSTMTSMAPMAAAPSVEETEPAPLKTSDEEEQIVAASSNDTDTADDDAEKDDSGGKNNKSRAHFLTIRDEDYDRLQDGEFLNDTLIDFWFQWIWRKERHSATDVHFFTSHFYSTLAKGGPKAVTSWTAKKNIDIFTKKFIFIPINQSLHWSLCVVVNPGEIRNEIDECNIEVDDDSLFPCILFFDSLRAHRKNVIAKNVRNWLNSEWERLEKAKAPYEEAPFTNKTMKVFDPRVPYQDNSWDCGVFVCRYGFAIYLLRGRNITYADRNDKFRSLITESEEFDFDRNDIVRIRLNLTTLIDNLSALYKVWKKVQDEVEKKEEEESKKPAARPLLLENGDAGETAPTSQPLPAPSPAKEEKNEIAKEDEVVSTSEQKIFANAEEGKASSAEEQEETAPSSTSPKSASVQAEDPSSSTSPQPEPMESEAEKDPEESTVEDEDVEMADVSAAGDVMDEVMEDSESRTLKSRVLEVESVEAVQDVCMSDAEAVDKTSSTVVKMEEDQYVVAQDVSAMEDGPTTEL